MFASPCSLGRLPLPTPIAVTDPKHGPCRGVSVPPRGKRVTAAMCHTCPGRHHGATLFRTGCDGDRGALSNSLTPLLRVGGQDVLFRHHGRERALSSAASGGIRA